jgi:hypothetical protein
MPRDSKDSHNRNEPPAATCACIFSATHVRTGTNQESSAFPSISSRKPAVLSRYFTGLSSNSATVSLFIHL